eukprot:2716758-Pyramimonas_sp.AAC.1
MCKGAHRVEVARVERVFGRLLLLPPLRRRRRFVHHHAVRRAHISRVWVRNPQSVYVKTLARACPIRLHECAGERRTLREPRGLLATVDVLPRDRRAFLWPMPKHDVPIV